MTYLALIATTIALQAGGKTPAKQAAPARARSDSAVLVDTVVSAERAFFRVWNKAWITSDLPRRRYPGEGPWHDPSKADIACNPDPYIYVPDNAWGLNYHLRLISDAHSALAVCPNWFPPAGFYIAPAKVTDERLGIDGGLTARMRDTVRASRQRVIRLLDSAVRRMPSHPLLTGQLVRMLADQDSLDRALSVVSNCQTLAWWCNALSGYLQSRKGDLASAEMYFTAAAHGLVDADRCTWTDVGVLLDSAGRAAYRKMTCAERAALNEKFWWLADPLWSEPGNDRLVEQFARQVVTALHSQLGSDERYSWSPLGGGEALNQALNRYGWPTYTYFGYALKPGQPPPGAGMTHIAAEGVHQAAGTPKPITVGMSPNPIPKALKIRQNTDAMEDMLDSMAATAAACVGKDLWGQPSMCTGVNLHDILALSDPVDSVLPSLGSTIEYSVGRVHLVPHWSTFEKPFEANNLAWDLNAPRWDTYLALSWWPWEHYASPHPLMQIVDQQTALLRRQNGNLLAYATALGDVDLHRGPKDSVPVKLVVSSGPDMIRVLAAKRVPAVSTLTFLQALSSRPTMIGVEIPAGADSQAAARARFGVTPKAPLEAVSPGTIDISDPILLSAPTTLDALPDDIDDVLPLMLGSLYLPQGATRLGVYWETYGIAASDTVAISVRVQRTTPLSLVDRVRVMAGAGDPNVPVSVDWKEPDARHRVRDLDATVPIQMRSVVINIATLVPGAYTLEIIVTKLGRDAVRSARQFVVR